MCRSNHMGAYPPQRSAGGSAGAGEHHAEERCCSSPPCCSPRGKLPCYAPLRCAARPPAVEDCADAPTSPAGCPGGRQPWGATRGAGKRSLSWHGEARKSRCSRRAHAGWCPRTSRCCPALPTWPAESRSYASSRLVIHKFTRTCTIMTGTCCLCMAAILRVAAVLASSLPDAVKGRCCETLFSRAFNTLFVCTQVPRGCRGGRRPWRRLPAGRGTAAALPRMALSPHTPSPTRP